MEEPFKTLNEKSLKRKESLNLDTKMLQKKYNNLKQLWGKLRDKKKMALVWVGRKIRHGFKSWTPC